MHTRVIFSLLMIGSVLLSPGCSTRQDKSSSTALPASPPLSTQTQNTASLTITQAQTIASQLTDTLPTIASSTVTTATPSPTTSPTPAITATSTTGPLSGSIKVAVSASGFNPASITITQGSLVIVAASGHDDYTISSGDPIEGKLLIRSGGSQSLMFFNKGVFTYHLIGLPNDATCVVTVV